MMVPGSEHSPVCGPWKLTLSSFFQEPVFTKVSIHIEKEWEIEAEGRGEMEEEGVDGKMCAVQSRPLI